MANDASERKTGFWGRDKANGSPLAVSLTVAFIAETAWFFGQADDLRWVAASRAASFIGPTAVVIVALAALVTPMLVVRRTKRYWLIWGFVPNSLLTLMIGAGDLIVQTVTSVHLTGHPAIGFSSETIKSGVTFNLISGGLSSILGLALRESDKSRAQQKIEMNRHAAKDDIVGTWPPPPSP